MSFLADAARSSAPVMTYVFPLVVFIGVLLWAFFERAHRDQ